MENSKKSYVAMKVSKLGSLANLTETKAKGMYADNMGLLMANSPKGMGSDVPPP